MKKLLCLVPVLAVLSCASVPAPKADAVPAAPAVRAAPAPPAAASVQAAPAAAADSLKTLRSLRDDARTAFDSNHPVEALRHLVALLAVDAESPAESDAKRAAERAELVRGADAELGSIGAKLVLEPTDEWLQDGKQATGDLRALATGRGLKPAVRLVANYDYGKSVVADAPVRFAFAEGLGDLSVSGPTDSYGVASAVVNSVGKSDKGVVIRAVLAITERGRTKVFPSVSREFAYLAPGRVAKVYAYERLLDASRAARSVSDHAPLLDAVNRGLAASGLDLLGAEGAPDPASFMAALGGDQAAVAAALKRGGKAASYLVLALADCDEPKQLSLNGKTYEIYTATARSTLRILRSDGSAADTRPQLSAKGQGGNPDAAVQSALKALRDAVEKDLAASAAALRSALD